MRRVRLIGGVACVLVGLAALLVAWLQSAPDLDADDARMVAEESLSAVGLAGVEVERSPQRDAYEPLGGGETIDAWRTVAVADGGTVELWVAVSDGALVFLRDRTDDEAAQLLTDEQFEELASTRVTPTLDRRLRRNLVVTGAVALLALTAGALVAWPAPPASPPPGRDQGRGSTTRRAGSPRQRPLRATDVTP